MVQECWGTDEFKTLDTPDPTYLFAPLFLPVPFPPYIPVFRHNHHSFNTCPVRPHLFFSHDVPLVGHLCQMKIYIFPSSIQMPPFLGILPGLPHPALASLVPPELPEPSGYMSLTPECSVLHAVFMCLPLPPVSRLRQTHTKSLHPYPPCWHRVCFRGGCPEMFIG